MVRFQQFSVLHFTVRIITLRCNSGEEYIMIKTIEAVVEKDGTVRLLEHIEFSSARRAVVTILDEEEMKIYLQKNETAFVSEPSLAKDWNRTEEDEAWSHLQPAV